MIALCAFGNTRAMPFCDLTAILISIGLPYLGQYIRQAPKIKREETNKQKSAPHNKNIPSSFLDTACCLINPSSISADIPAVIIETTLDRSQQCFISNVYNTKRYTKRSVTIEYQAIYNPETDNECIETKTAEVNTYEKPGPLLMLTVPIFIRREQYASDTQYLTTIKALRAKAYYTAFETVLTFLDPKNPGKPEKLPSTRTMIKQSDILSN